MPLTGDEKPRWMKRLDGDDLEDEIEGESMFAT
jgi:hypothetical protein